MPIPTTLPLLPDVQLRPPRPDDAAELGKLVRANLEHLEPWMPWVHAEYGPADALHWIIEGGEHQWMIERRRRIAGTIGFHRIDTANHATSIGYWLAADAQGEGIVSTAVPALCAAGFAHGLHRIELRAALGNLRSRAVADRCGFGFEGVARDAELVHGSYRDLAVYSLLAPSGPGSTF